MSDDAAEPAKPDEPGEPDELDELDEQDEQDEQDDSGPLGDLGGLGDMESLFGMAAQMQQQFAEAQDAIAGTIVEGQAGGGVVRVEVTGGLEFRSVTISPEAVDPDDVEMLQDLVLAAIHDGVARVNEMAQQTLGPLGMLGGMTGGGLDLGGLDLGGFDLGGIGDMLGLGGGGAVDGHLVDDDEADDEEDDEEVED